MRNARTATLTVILLAIITLAAAATFANAQTNHQTEEKLVEVAQRAGNQIQTLITNVYADPEAVQKIENANLTSQFENNVTQYQNEGLTKLTQAQEALSKADYSAASDSALAALEVFRNTYSNLEGIMDAAGIASDSSASSQQLLDAIDRELQRIGTLKEILLTNASQNILQTLDDANKTLLQAKTSALNGQTADAQAQFVEAKQAIAQIYTYLKTQAEQSNTWRLNEFCQRLMRQIQERFAYGKQSGVDFSGALAAKGYQSEKQFIQALQTKIMNAQSQGDIQNAIADCESIGQMVQQMQQSLNQEISSQQQNQSAANGSGTGGEGANSGSSGAQGSNGAGGSSGSGSGSGTKSGK